MTVATNRHLFLSTALLLATALAGQGRSLLQPHNRTASTAASNQAATQTVGQPLPAPHTVRAQDILPAPAGLADGPDFGPLRDVTDKHGNVLRVEAAGNPYVLSFTNGDYTPTGKIDPALARALRRDAAATTYGFVMLKGSLSTAKLDRLQKLGLRILGLHTYQSVKVQIPARAFGSLMAEPFVKWVGYARPAQKVSAHLWPQLQAAKASDRFHVWVNPFESDLNKNSITRHQDVEATGDPRRVNGANRYVIPNGRFHQALTALGFQFELYEHQVHAFKGHATKAQILKMLEQDWVHYIEPVFDVVPHDDQGIPMMRQDGVRRFRPGRRIPVGVIDSGIDATPYHNDLRNKMFIGWSNVSGRTAWDDRHGHGQHIMGTICGNGSADVRYKGACPAIGTGGEGDRIFLGKIFDDRGNSIGDPTTQFANLSKNFVVGGKTNPYPRLVNCSWGSSSVIGFYGTELLARSADSYSHFFSQLLVFSAGNQPSTNSSATYHAGSPGSSKNALTVGSVKDTFSSDLRSYPGQRSTFSRYGVRDGRTKPEVCAPGDIITSLGINTQTGYVNKKGTSMAAPGAVGCLASLCEGNRWYLTRPEAMKAVAMAAATNGGWPFHNSQTGYGLMNSYKMSYADTTTYWAAGGTFGSSGQSTVLTYTIPSDAEEVRLVLCWSEPPASAGATKARLSDVRAYVDAPPYTSNNFSGDYTLRSGNQNCISLTGRGMARAIRGKTVRIKLHAAFVSRLSQARWATCLFVYKKDPWASFGSSTGSIPNLSVWSADAVKPGELLTVSGSLRSKTTGDQFSNARMWFQGSTAFNMERMRRFTEDSDQHDYVGRNYRSYPWPRIVNGPAGGLVLGAGKFRNAYFWLRAPRINGVYPIELRATYHTLQQPAPYLRATRNVCVDGLAPNTVAGLRSGSHTAGQWSNQRTLNVAWNTTADNGCAGLVGYGTKLNAGSAATPTSVNKAATVRSESFGNLQETGSGYYFSARAIDKAGNQGAVASIGPFKIDYTKPAVNSVTINNGAASTTSTKVDVVATASDVLSGVVSLRYSGDNRTFTPWRGYTTGRVSIDFAPLGWGSGLGRKFVYVQARDRAGNVSPSRLAYIEVKQAPQAPRIQTVAISSLENVTKGYYRLLGSGFLKTQRVYLGSRTITNRHTTAHENWWADGAFRPVSDTELWVYPPQGLAIGSHSLRVNNGQNSNIVTVRATAARTMKLETASVLTAGQAQTALVSQGNQPNRALALMIYSPELRPSVIPGFVRLSIGNNFSNWGMGPWQAFNSAKVAGATAVTPTFLKGATIYFQAAILNNGTPLPTTNVVATVYR